MSKFAPMKNTRVSDHSIIHTVAAGDVKALSDAHIQIDDTAWMREALHQSDAALYRQHCAQPSLFTHCERIYRSMIQGSRDQILLFAGSEDGANSETMKLAAHYFIRRAQMATGGEEIAVADYFAYTMELWEMLTLNSTSNNTCLLSTQLQMDFDSQTGSVEKIKLLPFLPIDTSAITDTTTTSQLRIFQYLLNGASKDLRTHLRLDYGDNTADVEEQERQLQRFEQLLIVCGVQRRALLSIYELLAAIIHLAQLTTEDWSASESVNMADKRPVQNVAALIRMDSTLLADSLSHSINDRNSLISVLFNGLLSYLTDLINTKSPLARFGNSSRSSVQTIRLVNCLAETKFNYTSGHILRSVAAEMWRYAIKNQILCGIAERWLIREDGLSQVDEPDSSDKSAAAVVEQLTGPALVYWLSTLDSPLHQTGSPPLIRGDSIDERRELDRAVSDREMWHLIAQSSSISAMLLPDSNKCPTQPSLVIQRIASEIRRLTLPSAITADRWLVLCTRPNDDTHEQRWELEQYRHTYHKNNNNYPHQFPFAGFLERFALISYSAATAAKFRRFVNNYRQTLTDLQPKCVDLLHRVCNEDDIDQQKHLYLVGATRVYLSQALLEQLEWRLEQKYTVSARLIQNWWRNRFSRQMVPTSYQEINETAVIMRGLGLNGPKWDPMDKLSTELASWIFDDILQSNHVMYGQRHVYRIRDLMDKLQDGQVILTAMEAIFDELPAVDRQDIDAVFNLISAILRCAIGSDEESAVDDDSQHSSTFLSAKDFNDNPAKVLSILQRFRQYVIEKQRETDDVAVVKREVHLHEQGSTKSSFTSPWSLAISQRRFICKGSVWEVVSNSTVKERVLYLFSDLLLIAKESASVQSANNPTNTQIRTIVDLSQMQLVEDRHLDPVIERPKRDPVIRKAINLFDRLNARHAIEYLVEKQFVSATAQSVAYFLYHTPGLNPRQLGRFLGVEDNREILLAYLNYYEFSGLRLDWALRLFFQLFRLPGDPDAIDGILQAFADRFTACNPSVCADSYFVLKLVLAILMLNAQWHGREGQAITAIDTTEPFRMTSEQFVAGLLQSVDEPVAGDLLSEEYLSAVYVGIQSDRLSVAMTLEEEEDKMRIQFSPLPYRLTVDEPSQSITVRLPQPDPGLRIRIFSHGSLECNVQDLAFTDSSEQKFMLTGTKIGRQSISFVKYGPSAGRYANSSLPFAGQAIIVGPPFMRHVFQLRTIHRDPETRRKITYLFSVANDKQQENWSMQIRTVLQMLSGNTLIDYGLPMDNEQALKLLQFFDCDSSSCEGVKFVPTDARERLEFSKQ